MLQVKCKQHDVEFQLPSTEEEFLLGSLHEQVECLSEHSEKYPKCKFQEIRN